MLARPHSGDGGHSGQSEVADPILLGDFVVDAYNRYLEQARELTPDGIVHSLPSVAPLGAVTPTDAPQDESRPRTHGADPRLGKMAEVLLAAGQLVGALQSGENRVEDTRDTTLDTLLAALAALADLVDSARQSSPDLVGEAVYALVKRYNTTLEVVYETCDDPIVPRLFTTIGADGVRDDSGAFARALAELSISATTLTTYLRRALDRAQPASGMRGNLGRR